MRAASGSAERENNVGSLATGDGKRDTGNVLRETGLRARWIGTVLSGKTGYNRHVRQLESLDAWKVAQELAYKAYVLTLNPGLKGHFALLDQIRRAAISIPANMAEGYALSTTAQFVRCLRIALGSASELRSHLSLLQRLRLTPETDVTQGIDLSNRTISMLVGLLRKLNRHGRVPCPVSRVPT